MKFYPTPPDAPGTGSRRLSGSGIASYARPTCRARTYDSEEEARRSLWAIRQNGRLGDRFDVKRCSTCLGWHIARVK